MSGGEFDYKQYVLQELSDSIERTLANQGKEKPKEELWGREDYYEKYPEEKLNYTYPEEIQEKMREAIKALKIAHVYAQRVDWYLSGDDGEESFLSRLEEELNEIK